MRYICVITLLYFTSSVTSKFPFPLKLNHLLLKLNISQHAVSRVEEKWIKQPLDHFNKNEKRTFQMRYYQNLDFWKPSGPIYIFIGGEAQLYPSLITNDPDFLMSQMAKDTKGAMFGTEHRYYGKSLPDIPNSDQIKYYTFLSSQQALADVASLIMTLKLDPKYRSSKVVVVGGSYAGNLAAWMRALYPHLVDAAVASSAPVLAKKDFREYLDVVRHTFAKYGTEHCLNHIENTFKRYGELLQTTSGIEQLKNELNICPDNDLTVLENKQYMFNLLYHTFMVTAQFGPPPEVVETCNNLYELSSNSSKLDRLNVFHHTNSKVKSECLDVDFSTSTRSQSKDDDAWTYQYCNEFGYLRTTSSEKQPFVHWNPLEFCLKFCNGFVEGDIEKRIDEGVAKTNAMYGGLSPKVSKVVFTHGDMDPWHALGVLRDLAPDAPAIIINGTAHCDVLIVGPGEPKEMKVKRKYIKGLIKNWIS